MMLRESSEFMIAFSVGCGRRAPGGGADRRLEPAHFGERFLDVGDEDGEGTRQRIAARHQHVIMAGRRRNRAGAAQRLFQAAADAIALDRVADLLGDGEADAGRLGGRLARRRVGGGARIGLQGEALDLRATAARDALKLRAAPQASQERGMAGGSPCVFAQGVRLHHRDSLDAAPV